jgi:hypothetical protein
MSNTPKDRPDAHEKPLKVKTLTPRGSEGKTTKLTLATRDPRSRRSR